jgi:AcrR family transcriptional regulator
MNVKPSVETRLSDAARELFYRRGVRAVGVDEIVAEAGVTKPSLYRLFGSKDALIAACAQRNVEDGRAALAALVEAAGVDPRAQFRAVFSAYAQMIDGPDFRGCPLSNVAIELAAPDHPGHVAVRDGKTILHDTLARIAGDLGVAAPQRLADALILVIEGAMVTRHIFGANGPAAAMTATCEALVDAHLHASAAA